jgi:hypothetical protein
MEQIKDGKGKGYLAAVNSEHQLLVNSRSVTAEHWANHVHGKAWNANFKTSITGTSKKLIHYFKNTGTSALIFEGISWNVSQNVEIELIGNVIGTPVGGTDMDIGILSTGSNSLPDMTAQYGDGITGITGGSLMFRAKQAAGNYSVNTNFEADVILSPNTAIGIYCTPAAGYDMLGFYILYDDVEDA